MSKKELNPQIQAAVDAVERALNTLIVTEIEVGDDLRKYVNVEKLTRMAGTVRGLYRRSGVGDFLDDSEDADFRPARYRGGLDQADMVREALMVQQKQVEALNSPRPLTPAEELSKLVNSRKELLALGIDTTEVDARIRALAASVNAPPKTDDSKPRADTATGAVEAVAQVGMLAMEREGEIPPNVRVCNADDVNPRPNPYQRG